MEDGTRSAPATGFQKFLLDPKSSVKTYLSEIQEKDKHNWQQNGGNPNQQGNWQQQQQYGNNGQQGYQGQGSNLNLPGSGYPDRPTSAAANHPFQPQSHTPAPQQFGAPPHTGSFPLQSPPPSAGFAAPPHAPTPVHPEQHLSAQFAQHTQQITQHPQQTPAPQHDQPYAGPPSAYYPTEPNHAQHAQNQSVSSLTVTSTSTEVTSASRSGLAPPGHEHHDAVVAAPKQYHRMIVEFETVKAVYFAAKIQPAHGDLVPIANKLKNLAHEIWNLRYTKSSEFTFPDAAHEQIITTWKAQFDLWTHVLEDLYDPVYVKSVEAADAQEYWAKLAGLTLGGAATPVKAPVKKVATKPKAVAPAAEGEEAPAATPVKKKVVKKVAAAGEGETETAKKTVVKKKVVKKVAAAE